MKLLFLFALFLSLLCAAGSAAAGEQSVLARITVYWRGEGSQFCACWNGIRLRDGHCAVDPKKIPFGSKVFFPDATCVAVDSGPAVVSRKAARACARTAAERSAVVIDRFFETRQQALSWEKSHPYFMNVRVVTADGQAAGELQTTPAQAAVRPALSPIEPKASVSRALCDLRAMFDATALSHPPKRPVRPARRHS